MATENSSEMAAPAAWQSWASFDGRSVRIVMIDGAPWFSADDVCAVLGLDEDPAVPGPLMRLDDYEIEDARLLAPGPDGVALEQIVAVVNESGLYSLVMEGRTPEAKRFKRWVTLEVLPALPRYGLSIRTVARMKEERTARLLAEAARRDTTTTKGETP
jgi:prophage antirepressor-like protein